MKVEKRLYALDNLQLRNEEGSDSRTLVGHAAVFNKRSEDLGGFVEVIAPGAFNDVLDQDVRALWNHDPNHILGRTKSGTLRIGVDDTGLTYEVDLPDTSAGKDLQISTDRGDVDQSSFAFVVGEDKWEEIEGGILRTVLRVDELRDVSPVTYPAYPDASVGIRSMEEFQGSLAAEKILRSELNKAELALRSAQLRLKELART